MAPTKRSRALSDSAESDEETSTPAGIESRKRSRISDTSDTARVDSDESDQGWQEQTDSYITEALDNENELEVRATQIIQEKYAFASDEPNVPADHGILERVECYNFMCHEHFYVELGPLINFIVGKNGSGKSAVLTAITLCLGGKASATNRGQSLKSFIKEGKESATIIVRIKNQGDGAYMPQEYGKSIIVERHFTRSGTSGFKLKSDSGRIVSTKKIELDAITDFFNLQIDNPMNVLSQDMARQFLSTSSPADKYKFFVKGVQLQQLDQDYRLIEESIDQIEDKLRSRLDDIKILEQRRDVAKRRLEMSDQHASLRDRVRVLRRQMAWAQVEEQERIRDSIDEQLVQADQKISAAETDVSRADALFQEAERESEVAAEVVRQAQGEVERVQDEKKETKSRLDEEMRERYDLQAQQRTIREYVKTTESRIKQLNEDIAKENQRLADISGGSYTRMQTELEQKQEEASEARKQYEEHQKDTNRVKDNIKKAEEDHNSKIAPVEKVKSDIEQAENVLRSLTKDRGTQDAGFDPKLPMLLRAIRNDNSFSKQPVGPIGHHVRLLKPKWSSILETSFGATLTSFVVTSKRDMNILSNIMKRVKCELPIFIGSEGYIDTSEHEPDAQFDTALRVLEIDNDLVRRQLIINHGIEQMLLIEKLEEASSVLFDGQRPKNVKRCYCIDPNDRRRGIHLSYSRSGDPSQTPVAAYTGRSRMRTDSETQIRMQKEIIDDLKRQLSDLQNHARAARSHLESCKQALVRHERKEKDLQIAIQRLEDQVEELRDDLEREAVDAPRLDVLKGELEEAEEEKQLNEGSYADSVKAMDAIMDKLKKTRREINAKDAEIASLEEQLRIAQSEEAKVQDKRRRALGDKNAAIGRVEDAKQDKARIQHKREQIEARIIDYNEKASMVSPRVPVDEGETPNSLDEKLDRLYKDLQRFNDQMGASREEIAAEAMKANNAYDQAKRQVTEFRTLADIFKNTLRHRKKRWALFRAHISSRAKAQFTYLLSERSFRGRLLADHEGKLLDLQVEPDITKDSAGRGAKTLSGGEKSFSQVCLLLSLWEAMGSPIRCLDEFDVYMDSVNRKMAIDMLMLAARRSIGRQFILITPGSRAEISLAPDVRVKELAEPQRGQRTLSFRQN
ncbi:DNA repair protein [Paecilomyces variotii]|uniref:DNA repair protein n=1 Tax=Byssochlamys spectabilis TaxID=264951 RepID=A0A443I479_BYSSP|nr:DNA repair protein [Paecilomyces variotii]KAJ9359506.1 hypothetical protein DTO280E4_4606 [Paecilomyces variotii]RWQ98825.1 DNA repair protein [Paecilomyces variotii]